MPQGKHSSVRVALAVPPKLHEQLAAWAEYEGRPVASLCMYLIEQALRQAQKDGIAPSFKEVVDSKMEGHPSAAKEVMAEEDRRSVVEEAVREGKYTKSKDEMTKKELLMAAISEALFD